MQMFLTLGGNPIVVDVEKEFHVCDPRGKIIGTIRAKSEREGLARAKRSTKKFPNASFLRTYEPPAHIRVS